MLNSNHKAHLSKSILTSNHFLRHFSASKHLSELLKISPKSYVEAKNWHIFALVSIHIDMNIHITKFAISLWAR